MFAWHKNNEILFIYHIYSILFHVFTISIDNNCIIGINSWTFNEKEWDEGKEHWEELKSNPRVIMGDDPISSWYNMNDVCSPQLEEVKLEKHE